MARSHDFTRRMISSAMRLSVFVASIGIAWSCQSERSTGIPLGDVGLAKGGGAGGGGGGSSVAPTVTSATPSSAFQDTTLDVVILGAGFTAGAKATWSLAGDTTLVHVKSTKVLASDRILVQIDVPSNAPIAAYDVEVLLSNGKKGVGAEMFKVLDGGPRASFWFPLDDATLSVRSDHLYLNGDYSVYGDAVCGVNSRIFTGPDASGDAIMHTDNRRYADKKCPQYPRRITVVYGPGDSESVTTFMNLRAIVNSTFTIPIGATERRALAVRDSRCEGFRFSTRSQTGEFLGADSVNVTRVDASTWNVETQPFPDNEAYCNATGQKFNMNLRFTVKADRPLP